MKLKATRSSIVPVNEGVLVLDEGGSPNIFVPESPAQENDGTPKSPLVAGTPHLSSDIAETPPNDKHNLAYLIVFLLGVASMVQWNALLASTDFYDNFYPSIRAAFTFPFINTVPGFVVAACMMFWGEKLPMTPAIAGGLGVCALGMQAIVIMIIAKAEDFPGSKTILNILVALNGAAAGIATSASFSFAAQFPPLYIQAFFSGQGVCGIAITCVAFLLKAVLNDKKRNEERVMWLVFYQVSAVVVLVAVFAYFVLLKLPITLYYTKQRVEVAVKLHHYGTVHSFHSVEAITDSLQKEEKKSILKDTKHVVREILPLGFGVAFVFSVTLAVFPGLSGSIPSEMGLGNWYSLILLALFMIGDVVGRIFAKWFVLFSERTVLFPILARVVFIWFFLMPHTTSWKIPDPIVMIVMLLMAISNGYLASLAMMFGPSKVDHEFRKLAGGAMYVFLVSGLLAGTGMAFAFRGMGL